MGTGIDLVEQMIRVAAGEKLTLAQPAVRLDGWAVEARVYAEDPRREFLPSSGRLVRYREPGAGQQDEAEATLRIDSGVEEGSEIPLFYDPMIAKLVTHAPTRDTAIEAMTGALDRFVIEGIDHNLPFLSALMAHPRWRSGDLSTGFIAEEFGERFAAVDPEPDLRNRLAAVALSMELLRRERLERLPGRIGGPPPWQEDWVVLLGREPVPLRCPGGLPLSPIELDIVFPGEERPVALTSRWTPGDPLWSGAFDGEPIAVQVRRQGAATRLRWRGVDVVARVVTPMVAALQALMPEKTAEGSSRQLVTPMPGRLVSIAVAAGQPVKSGEPLAVVEAMKMENILRADRDLRVASIRAAPGEILAADAVIMEFD
jgi:propionyl-CoA carboxylase alpha chain